jgi:hypothetical protein
MYWLGMSSARLCRRFNIYICIDVDYGADSHCVGESSSLMRREGKHDRQILSPALLILIRGVLFLPFVLACMTIIRVSSLR